MAVDIIRALTSDNKHEIYVLYKYYFILMFKLHVLFRTKQQISDCSEINIAMHDKYKLVINEGEFI